MGETEQGVARPPLFVPDPIAGYAIGGHDPVSYFVDHRPRLGSRKFSYKWGGAEWVFVNQGNLAAFRKNPEIYAPLFAACGAYALSNGFATAGNPFIFAIVGRKLIFFHSEVNRFLFLVNDGQLLKDAEANAQKTGCVASR
ncbi:YHS domain-containing (seleno)protein [uncultured Roseibium sp.]|uniref:YHS domain-containing (seleno)protein n=1 Tax=uncultured Roseibium sp. TaxID=1936171 RepID=UPI00321775CF